MEDIFASLYELFGLIPIYSKDLGDHLRGFDVTCSAYTGRPLYNYIGWLMIGSTVVTYVLIYHIINDQRFKSRVSWWITALALALINFFIAFTITFNDLKAGDYCAQLNFNTIDCSGFGIINAFWSFILFLLITSPPYPRKLAYNTSEMTFWKPKH